MTWMPGSWLVAVVSLAIQAVAAGQANAGPTTQFTVTGDVVAPATYALSDLQALPPTTDRNLPNNVWSADRDVYRPHALDPIEYGRATDPSSAERDPSPVRRRSRERRIYFDILAR
jgi:hypothetical protein